MNSQSALLLIGIIYFIFFVVLIQTDDKLAGYACFIVFNMIMLTRIILKQLEK